MKICSSCQRRLPDDYVQNMFMDGNYYPVCAKCANRLMGGLRGEVSTEILRKQLEWEKDRNGHS